MTIAGRRGWSGRRLRWLVLSLALLAGCTLGSETPPGCRVDHPEDCEPGWVCRAGACFAFTTGATTRDGGTDAGLDAKGDVADDPVEEVDAPAE